MDIELSFGEYRIEQGGNNPCEHPEKLWLFNGIGEGMEVRCADLEGALGAFSKSISD